MRRSPFFLVVPILAVIVCQAQADPAPTRASVEAQLRAPDAASVAWGGYLAAEHRLHDAVPSLLEALASPRLGQPGLQWKGARFAVLDALIRLGASPPPEILAAHYASHGAEVLILLSSPGPGRDEALLQLIKGEAGIPWFGMAGLLLEAKAPGLAAELLRGLRLTLRVTVVDGRRQGDALFDTADVGAIGHGYRERAPGFPPIATHTLWDTPVRGATVLASGPQPIYYTRLAGEGGWIPSGPTVFVNPGPDAGHRLAYLGALMERWLPVEAVEAVTRRWTTPARLRRDVANHRTELERRFGELVQLARKDGHLTANEARDLRPAIEVRVSDRRQRRTAPLPDLSR